MLKTNAGEQTCIAEYSCCGTKRSSEDKLTPTLCLENIRLANGTPVADHMWFKYSRRFRKLGELTPGDTIKFKASAATYRKGRVGKGAYKTDYKLISPKQIEKVNNSVYVPLPNTTEQMLGYVIKKSNKYINSSNIKFVEKYNDWKIKMAQNLTNEN